VYKRQLVDRLMVVNPELWGLPSGKALTAKALGYKLKEYYGVSAGRYVTADGKRSRGFARAEVRKAWKAVGLAADDETRTVVQAA
jgi:hypothetical protein